MKLYIFPKLIIPNEGTFKYEKIGLQEAKKLVKNRFISGIRSSALAKVFSLILETKIPSNRIVGFRIRRGDIVLILKLKTKISEDKSFNSIEELGQLEYEFYTLKRIH